MGEALTLRVDGGRPLTAATILDLDALCDRAEADVQPEGSGLVTVHATGVPPAGWAAELTVGLVTKWERAVRRFERLGRLTAAVVSGDCAGPALDVLLAADVRIAAPEARLLLPAGHDATWPGMAVHRLAQQAGSAAIRRAVLLGTPIEASRGLALGLLDEVREDPDAALVELAESGRAFAAPEIAIRRRLILDAVSTGFEEALGAHLAAADRFLRREATP
ncbi:Enoyl-CoA hydratase/isomerase [[Actinomadura] parvosata subsp. kistnae]|nr:enoyl-CoA-hydratase DpgB [Nonomuraea sp. ATCC 55076]SPL92146.1 Enoyl-CoA hydratase/isomerase [Actinomadura parvosata subsp. kistnae]